MDAVDEKKEACGDGKLPQSQRPGGKKRMVAVFVAFVGAGYSVSASVDRLSLIDTASAHSCVQEMSSSSAKSPSGETNASMCCQGMQYNPGIRTIEGELCKAMCAAGCISPQNAKDPTKVWILTLSV